MVSALVLLIGVIICGWIAGICISLLMELDGVESIHSEHTSE